MKRTRQTFVVAALAAAGICTAISRPALAALPTPDEIAKKLGIPESDKQKVLNGEFVSRNLESSNERELAVAMAFYVPVPVADIKKQASDNVLSKRIPKKSNGRNSPAPEASTTSTHSTSPPTPKSERRPMRKRKEEAT